MAIDNKDREVGSMRRSQGSMWAEVKVGLGQTRWELLFYPYQTSESSLQRDWCILETSVLKIWQLSLVFTRVGLPSNRP